MKPVAQLLFAIIPPRRRWLVKQKLRYWYRGLRAGDWRGNVCYCACCGWHLSAFDLVPPRDSKQCPRCRAGERQRLLTLYFSKIGLFNQVKNVLHVAPEYVLAKQFLNRSGIRYTSCDYAVGFAEVQADLMNLPFKKNEFDFVLCCHVLEHVDDDKKAMAELFRVIQPSGILIAMVPFNKTRAETYEDATITSPVERLKHFGQEDHVREYGLDFVTRLESAGFKVETIEASDVIPISEWDKNGLMDEQIFVCRVPSSTE